MERHILATLCLITNCYYTFGWWECPKPRTSKIDLQLVRTELEVPFDPQLVCCELTERPLAKYKQYWNGTEVYGYGTTVDVLTGREISSNVVEGIDAYLVDSDPALTATDALNSIYDLIFGDTATITTDEILDVTSDTFNEDFEIIFDRERDLSSHELVIYISSQNIAHLVYKFDIRYINVTLSGDIAIENAIAIVNAKTGELLKFHPYKKSASESEYNMKGYGGNENAKIGLYRYGADKWLTRYLVVDKNVDKCIFSRNVELYEYFCTKSMLADCDSRCFDCLLNDIYEEECDPNTTDNTVLQAHDAYFFVNNYVDVLKNEYNYNILSKCELKICVNVPNGGLAKFDYFLDVNPPICQFTFHKNSDVVHSTAGPSVAAHEVGHSITHVEECVDVMRRQSNAIDEAFADYLGAFYKSRIIGNGKFDWIFGSEIYKETGEQLGIRHMDNPGKDKTSIQCTKHYFRFLKSMLYNSDGVRYPSDLKTLIKEAEEMGHFGIGIKPTEHFMNGIFNKAFHNLVTIEGLNENELNKLLLRTAQFFWRRSNNFNEFLENLMAAAYYDRTQSLELVEKITRAFSKVGLYANIDDVGEILMDACANTFEIREIKAGCNKADGWLTFEEEYDKIGESITFCFKVMNKEKLNYNKAKEACEKQNAHLAIIDTPGKDKFISEMIKYQSYYYIGAKYERNTSTWFWRPTVEFPGYEDYEMLYKKDKINNENNNFACLTAKRKNIIESTWFKTNCAEKHYFICELACL